MTIDDSDLGSTRLTSREAYGVFCITQQKAKLLQVVMRFVACWEEQYGAGCEFNRDQIQEYLDTREGKEWVRTTEGFGWDVGPSKHHHRRLKDAADRGLMKYLGERRASTGYMNDFYVYNYDFDGTLIVKDKSKARLTAHQALKRLLDDLDLFTTDVVEAHCPAGKVQRYRASLEAAKTRRKYPASVEAHRERVRLEREQNGD